jgi:REP element-mobilizing transposase RayT
MPKPFPSKTHTEVNMNKTGNHNQRGDLSPLQPGTIYHIYNRGVNGETIFREQRNYDYFFTLYARHIQAVADTYAFCLLPNHFHLLIEVKNLTGLSDLSGFKPASQAFSNFFNAYAKAINKTCLRTGPLFERPFKRIPVMESDYFARLLIYIHYNPQHHGIVADYRTWPYSSYQALTGNQATFVKRDLIREWFGDLNELLNSKQMDQNDITKIDIIDNV